MFSSKGQGLSMNVIIIAAIALVVLIVVILIFTGKINNFSSTAETCQAQGGQCVSSNTCGSTVGVVLPGADCQSVNLECCVKL